MSPNLPSHQSSLQLTLPTAHCAGCRGAVLHELELLTGIVQAEVEAGSGRASITYDSDEIDRATIVSCLTEAGYAPLPDRHNDGADGTPPTEPRHLRRQR